MVKAIASSGFTLVELMVVLALIAIVATGAFFGLSQSNNVQPLINAQKELVSALRSIQNQVINGSDGVSVKSVILPIASNCTASSCSYTVVNSYLTSTYQSTVVNLPRGIQFANLDAAKPTAICFSNPNLTNFEVGQVCVTDVTSKLGCTCAVSPCTSFIGFICNGGSSPTLSSVSAFDITLLKGSAQKVIRLEGSGMKINRIYEP